MNRLDQRHLVETSGDKRLVVNIVVYDNIRGYLNWMLDWFKEAARDKCSTKCIISVGTQNVSRSI
jgi:hypothetical protein